MNERVRVAHVGLAHPHGPGYLRTLAHLPEIEVVALCDTEPEATGALIPPAYDDRPVYRDLATLLAEHRPEAVVIALPNDEMPAAIKAAAEAGAHVFAEKPCARSAREFLPAATAIRNAGLQFGTGYLRRASVVGRAIKEMVDRAQLGRLVSVETRWITTSVAVRNPSHFYFQRGRSGGGMLHLEGCHWLDFMRWVTSAEVVEVAAILDNLSGEAIDVEDTAVLSLRFSNGMIGSLHGGHALEEKPSHLYFGLRGMHGWVEWEEGRSEFRAHSTHPSWRSLSRAELVAPDGGDAYGGAAGIAAFREFIASFRAAAPPLFTVTDALRVLEIIDAAQESARTGLRVAVNRPL